METVLALFLIVVAACVGGVFSKLLRFPALVGYVIVGIVFGMLMPQSLRSITSLSEVGMVLLLFSIGLELPLGKLSKFFSVSFFGSFIQIVLTTLVFYFLLQSFGISQSASLVLSLGFSLSSTAVVVKMLSDAGEMDTIHGGLMLGWLLVQDLAVIPMMVILPAIGGGGASIGPMVFSLVKVMALIGIAVFLGKIIVPNLIHRVASFNMRELLLLTSVSFVLGTALLSYFFGISAALGAFLAGVVISESLEHHAIFAETRPLRDLFVALFFVSLGFLVNPASVMNHLPLIVLITFLVLILKSLIVFIVSQFFGHRGRTAVSASFGLAQVGEFAFVIFSTATALKLLSPADASLGISVVLLTLIISPVLYKLSLPFWRQIRKKTFGNKFFGSLFSTAEKGASEGTLLRDHIIICGYGRVGGWVGKAFSEYKIPFVVVEYNQSVVSDLKAKGVDVLYGDPTEPEVMEGAGIRNAKAVILAIPDKNTQETLVAYVQTVAPQVKIITRVHKDEDYEKLKSLRVDKIVQPEFEAAIAIVRSVLTGMGKPKEEILESLKSLRLSHSR
jgi:CPA2 family monovalent cation:H+ antiporter-2